MRQRSSFLFATWSFLSLFAAAGLCTAEPLLQREVPSPGLAQPRLQQERRAQSSQSQSPQPLAKDQAQPLGGAPSPFGPADPSQLHQSVPEPTSRSQSPVRRRSVASRRTSTGVCTFTAYQVQVCTISAELDDYLQINTLFSPDHTVAVDVRQQRPIAEFNSYQRLHTYDDWSVATLTDGRTLTITRGEEGDLSFAYGGAEWSEETNAEDDALGWCEDREWYEGGEDWSCTGGESLKQRKRTLHCNFSCSRIERIELK